MGGRTVIGAELDDDDEGGIIMEKLDVMLLLESKRSFKYRNAFDFDSERSDLGSQAFQ